jgi:hypothetical protein
LTLRAVKGKIKQSDKRKKDADMIPGRAGAVVIFYLCILVPLAANSQVWEEDSDLDIFYGKKSFQEIQLGLSPWSDPAGGCGEIDFGYNTLSKKSDDSVRWRNYYGAAIELALADFEEYEFHEYGERDISCWWGSVVIESKFFFRDDHPFRPYAGAEFTFGIGGLALSDLDEEDEEDEEDDLPADVLQFFQMAIEAGFHIMLSEHIALVIADTTSYGLGTVTDDSFQVIQTMVSIGISKWTDE